MRYEKCCGTSLHWRYNGHDSLSNHQRHDCLLNRLFRCRSKKTSKLCVTGLCVGNSPRTSEFPAQIASNTKNVSISWHHDVKCQKFYLNHVLTPIQSSIILHSHLKCNLLFFSNWTMNLKTEFWEYNYNAYCNNNVNLRVILKTTNFFSLHYIHYYQLG